MIFGVCYLSSNIHVYHMDDIPAKSSFGTETKLFTVHQDSHGFHNGKTLLEHIRLNPNSEYGLQHHETSSELIWVVQGSGYIQDDRGNRYRAIQGTLAYFEHGTRRGFITENDGLTFISLKNTDFDWNYIK